MKQGSILLYERQLFGHHPSYLRLVSSALLKVYSEVRLAVLDVERAKSLIGTELADQCSWSELKSSKLSSAGVWDEIESIMTTNSCDEIFFNAIDEIISSTLRRAAFGIYPSKFFKGKINGIYIRPRCLDKEVRAIKEKVKAFGWKRLESQNYFKHIFLLDERLVERREKLSQRSRVHFLPDPWEKANTKTLEESKKYWNIGRDRIVSLFYGTGSRRKGLDLLVSAFLSFPEGTKHHLLCVGQVTEGDEVILNGLSELEQRGLVTIANRYVSLEEEEFAFAACDHVILPYRGHYGSSGLIPRAAQALKPIIASNEGLVAYRVQENNLGETFQKENIKDLSDCILKKSETKTNLANLKGFSEKVSGEFFKEKIKQCLLQKDE